MRLEVLCERPQSVAESPGVEQSPEIGVQLPGRTPDRHLARPGAGRVSSNAMSYPMCDLTCQCGPCRTGTRNIRRSSGRPTAFSQPRSRLLARQRTIGPTSPAPGQTENIQIGQTNPRFSTRPSALPNGWQAPLARSSSAGTARLRGTPRHVWSDRSPHSGGPRPTSRLQLHKRGFALLSETPGSCPLMPTRPDANFASFGDDAPSWSPTNRGAID